MATNQEGENRQLAGFIRRLSLQQKLIIGGVTIGAITLLMVIVSFLHRPTYTILYSNLSAHDASKIIDKLKEQSIPYSLDDNGKTILVPQENMYDLRLSLAGDGLPQSSTVGYEIFDKSNLGISDFVQKVNYRRAIEGELARTIIQIDEVEAARVHIVLPEKKLFKEDEAPRTASVILKLKSGKPLNQETIQSISHLVASSIEGLEASNVTVVDSRGNLLSSNSKPNSLASLSSTQYQLQQQVESYLTQKAQIMLEAVLGSGNSIVQTTAELDFRQVDRTVEQYDPDNTAVRSEQVSEDKSTSGDSSPSSNRSNTITNYEVNKVVERIVENQGNIKRLTVAVTVNGKEKTVDVNGEKITELVPRTQEELTKITEIVKRAVGYNTLRNDEITVEYIPFATNVQNEEFYHKESPLTDWNDLIKYVLIFLAMAGAFFLLRSMLSKLRVSNFSIEKGYPDGINSYYSRGRIDGMGSDLQQIDMQSKKMMIADYVDSKPQETAKLLKVWLAEE